MKHAVKEYVRDDVHTNTIENFWSHLKRGITGIYHWASQKHLQSYVDEYVFRHNTREMGESGRFDEMMGLSTNKRMKFQNLIA